MVAEGIHSGLAAVQVVNLALLLAAIILMVVALRKLGCRSVGKGQRLIGLIPLLRSLAFLFVQPGRPSQELRPFEESDRLSPRS